MKLTILEGTQEEIQKTLQAICGSEERKIQVQIDALKSKITALEAK